MIKVDHIGIAVRDLTAGLKVWADALGLEVIGEEVVEGEGVRVAFLGSGEARVELLEATSGDGPIARFIAAKGEGLHHVCLTVEDIEAAMERCRERGLKVLDDEPRVGSRGCRVAFIHPKSAGGVLIELREVNRD